MEKMMDVDEDRIYNAQQYLWTFTLLNRHTQNSEILCHFSSQERSMGNPKNTSQSCLNKVLLKYYRSEICFLFQSILNEKREISISLNIILRSYLFLHTLLEREGTTEFLLLNHFIQLLQKTLTLFSIHLQKLRSISFLSAITELLQ